MNEYNGFKCDQYGKVYDLDGHFVGKLNGDTLERWVDDYLLGQSLGIYD